LSNGIGCGQAKKIGGPELGLQNPDNVAGYMNPIQKK
jgi:hypothetical protein